jgi:hypothetical protein
LETDEKNFVIADREIVEILLKNLSVSELKIKAANPVKKFSFNKKSTVVFI